MLLLLLVILGWFVRIIIGCGVLIWGVGEVVFGGVDFEGLDVWGVLVGFCFSRVIYNVWSLLVL